MQVEIRNRVGEGPLNEGCGAEWVQKVCSSLSKTSVIALDNVQTHFIQVISFRCVLYFIPMVGCVFYSW